MRMLSSGLGGSASHRIAKEIMADAEYARQRSGGERGLLLGVGTASKSA